MATIKEDHSDVEKSDCQEAFIEKWKTSELELSWRHSLKQVSTLFGCFIVKDTES